MTAPKLGQPVFFTSRGEKPRVAFVASVVSPNVVNLCVINEDGTTSGRTSVQYEDKPGAGSTSWSDKDPSEKPAKDK